MEEPPIVTCGCELGISSENWSMADHTITISNLEDIKEVCPPQLPDLMPEGPVLLPHESLGISLDEFLKVEDTEDMMVSCVHQLKIESTSCALELKFPWENWRMGHRTRTNSDFV
ncbi:unnamed protein product [Camellia sinensis]